ncbi:uncharacterized protein [Vicugna pacos]|uniref:Uncharacterized protein n=1 Tax=Vicugna pacos TaxID=30538 RepID=A0ABM5EFR9_VICPA
MLLPQLAPPRLARLSLRPLRLLPAAMTAPRAAGRGVRVRERERAGRWGGRARRRRRARGGERMRGRPAGRRARACCSHSLRGRKAKRACCTVTVGSPGAEGTRLTLPGCLLGLGEGHLRDRNEPERRQRRSQRGCFPCLKGAESPPLTAFSCCPPAALGEDSQRDFHRDALTAAAFHSKWVWGGEIVWMRNREDSLLCSCDPTKPLPHSKEGRIPETAAPNSVEAGLISPVDL